MEKQLLEKAIRIAVNAHAGQMDKAGFPYILHPLRVMMAVKTIRQKIIAVLHDLFEDTTMTPETLLNQGFPHDIIDDIIILTKSKGDDYEAYLNNIKVVEDSRTVKLADMKDNSNILRYHDLEEKHLKMVRKYHKGIKILEPDFNERLEL